MTVQTLWGSGDALERGWMVMRAEFVIKVGVGNRIRRKNWSCTLTEIHSHDQNFIFQTPKLVQQRNHLTPRQVLVQLICCCGLSGFLGEFRTP